MQLGDALEESDPALDLNEVAPDASGKNEWDANVGARMLYKLAAWTLASQGKAKIQ